MEEVGSGAVVGTADCWTVALVAAGPCGDWAHAALPKKMASAQVVIFMTKLPHSKSANPFLLGVRL